MHDAPTGAYVMNPSGSRLLFDTQGASQAVWAQGGTVPCPELPARDASREAKSRARGPPPWDTTWSGELAFLKRHTILHNTSSNAPFKQRLYSLASVLSSGGKKLLSITYIPRLSGDKRPHPDTTGDGRAFDYQGVRNKAPRASRRSAGDRLRAAR